LGGVVLVVDHGRSEVGPVLGHRVLRVVALQVGAVGVFHDAAVRVGHVGLLARLPLRGLGLAAADLLPGRGFLGGPLGHPRLVFGPWVR
jgi:hypothetical protein